MLGRGGSSDNKNSGTDDRPDSQSDQVCRPQHAAQAVFTSFMGFVKNRFQWFRGKEVGHSCPRVNNRRAISRKRLAILKQKTLRRSGGCWCLNAKIICRLVIAGLWPVLFVLCCDGVRM